MKHRLTRALIGRTYFSSAQSVQSPQAKRNHLEDEVLGGFLQFPAILYMQNATQTETCWQSLGCSSQCQRLALQVVDQMDSVPCVLSAMMVRICSNPSTGLRCTFNSDPRRYHTYGLLPWTLDGNFGTPHKSLQLARICSNLWTYKFASALGIHATSYLICGYTFADHQLVL